MGREIRKVPVGWSHPTSGQLADLGIFYGQCYVPLAQRDEYTPVFDRSYVKACREWMDQAKSWDDGTHDDLVKGVTNKEEHPFLWDWTGEPPSKSTHRFGPWDFAPDDAVAFQVYETVTEGTPISPVFEDRAALRNWLIGNGWSEIGADAFLEDAWPPTMIICAGMEAPSA